MPQGSLRRFPLAGVVLAFLVGLMLAGVLNLPGSSAAQQDSRYAAGAATPPAPAAVAGLQNLSEAFASVAESIKPSVVFIKSGKRGDRTDRRNPQFQLPPGFEEFFPRLPQMQPPEFQEAAGSGFIVSRDGYILTNDHVVDGSDVVTVRLLDRREFKAKVVGTDASTDLAVLKIDAANLTPAPLGDSDAARVGEWVLAVGNPLGENLTFTVTSGIISAKGRTLSLPNVSARSIQDFIQTDAAINPGNSGGPLVNTGGRVLGVNSAIASRTGFYSGYGFAIPINLARQVMEQIIAHGEVRRSVLGITVRDASANDAAYVGLPDIRGVLVEDFGSETSGAKQAGIVPGDIIVTVDGKPVEYVGQLQQRIAFRKPGETVKVEVARKGGVRKSYDVRLQAMPGATAAADPRSGGDGAVEDVAGAAMGRLGVTVAPVTAEDAARFDLTPAQRGLLVTDVTAGGPSYGELVDGDRGGPDIILEIEGEPVKSTAELRERLEGMKPGDIVSLRVYNTQAKNRRVERIKLGE
ncbi:MAG TPA: trypsin-like peptidase domain-containing protein [Gemmatimonadales bacterium]|nr:trypsin-like peptidase domain-containing protein [Gemmatimonadales bacterium]